MQHRSTARRRLVTVAGDYALADAGSPLLASQREIGTLIAREGDRGLAVVRVDKAGAAIAADMPIILGRQPVELALPGWSGLDFPAETDEAAP